MPQGDIQVVLASGSTNGRPIAVAGTSSGAATTLHTCTAASNEIDVVTVHGTNVDSAAVDITIQLGGTSTSDQSTVQQLAAKRGYSLLVDRARLNGGVVVSAFASSANKINCIVTVDRWETE
jgi:hypothetical protein